MKASDLDLLLPQPQEITTPTLRWASVTQVGPLRVKLDGDETALPITPGNTVAGLTPGDRVLTVLNGRQLVVLGKYGGTPFPYIPQPDKVTRVALTSNFDTGGNTWANVSWQTAVLDDAGAWSSGAPTLITVPAGVTRVHLTFYSAWSASTTAVGRFTAIERSTGGSPLVVSNRRELFESAEQITTGWISCAPGDAFRAIANSNGSGADLLGPASWAGPSWLEALFR